MMDYHRLAERVGPHSVTELVNKVHGDLCVQLLGRTTARNRNDQDRDMEGISLNII